MMAKNLIEDINCAAPEPLTYEKIPVFSPFLPENNTRTSIPDSPQSKPDAPVAPTTPCMCVQHYTDTVNKMQSAIQDETVHENLSQQMGKPDPLKYKRRPPEIGSEMEDAVKHNNV